MTGKVRKTLVARATANWRVLNKLINELNEEELIYALEEENKQETPRATVMRRLSQRLGAVRARAVVEEVHGGLRQLAREHEQMVKDRKRKRG